MELMNPPPNCATIKIKYYKNDIFIKFMRSFCCVSFLGTIWNSQQTNQENGYFHLFHLNCCGGGAVDGDAVAGQRAENEMKEPLMVLL